MNKTTIAGLVLVLLVAVAGASGVRGYPAQVQSAEKTTLDWMRTFIGKSENEILAELGPPTEKGTWNYDGKKQLTLTYQLSAKAKVSLFFVGDSLNTVSYGIIL